MSMNGSCHSEARGITWRVLSYSYRIPPFVGMTNYAFCSFPETDIFTFIGLNENQPVFPSPNPLI